MAIRYRLALLTAILAVLAGAFTAVSAPTAQAVGEDSGGTFVPVSPFRLVNTLTGTGGYATPFGGNGTRSFSVLGQGGIPASGVSAVVVDVAVKSTTAVGSSYIKVWPSGESVPNAASLFYGQENTQRSNTVISKVGNDGKISVFNYTGSTHLDIDIQGYFTTSSNENSTGGFVAIDPIRVASSPAGLGVPAVKLAPGASVDVQVTDGDKIPSDAIGVFANIEVRDGHSAGGVRVGPGGASTASIPPTINYSDSGPLSSGMTVKLSSDGKIRLTNDANGDAINFRVDIQGYFSSSPASGGTFTPLSPTTIYQSTASGGTAVPANGTLTVPVAGVGGVPDGGVAGSVALNVVAVSWSATGSLTVYNADSPPPPTTSVGFAAGVGGPASASLVVTRVSDDGFVTVRNSSTAPVDVYISVQGWFSAFVPDSGPSMTSYGVDEYELDDIAFEASEEGLTLQQAVARYGWQSDFADAVSALAEAHPDTFASASVDPSLSADAVVRFKGPVPPDAASYVAAVADDADVSLVGGEPMSNADVQEANETALDSIAAQIGPAQIETSYDRATGRVKALVYPEEAPHAVAQVASVRTAAQQSVDAVDPSYDIQGVDIEVVDAQFAEAQDQQDVRGGSRLNVYSNQPATCTSGFPARDNDTGQYGIITARHCSNYISLNFDLPSLKYPTVFLSRKYGDVQFHPLNWRSGDDFRITKSFYYDTGKTRQVTGISPPYVEGQQLCGYGRASHHRGCTSVYATNVSVRYDGDTAEETYHNLFLTNNCWTIPGDSGGPWYRGGKAVGVLSGRRTKFLSKDQCYVSPIKYGISAAHLSLYY